MYGSLLLALTALVLAGNVFADTASCQNSGQSGTTADGARGARDDVTLLQKVISVDAELPDEHKKDVETSQNKKAPPVVHVSDGTGPPIPAACKKHVWILNGFKKHPCPGAVANPVVWAKDWQHRERWDAGDTMIIVGMLVGLILFDIVSPQATYSLINHVFALAFMMIASAVFCILVWKENGEYAGIAWATGYALEWALSMDNLFVFHLVFKAFSVPNDQAMKALTIGIYGAVFFRVVFICFLSHLLSLSYAVDVIIGAVLILSGIASLSDDDEEDIEDMPTVRFCKWLFGDRLLTTYAEDGSLITKSEQDGRLQMTVLFLVVCVISVIDCVFAVDSVGSKTGQIKDLYINLTSSLMGMFSLRSLFFIIRDMAEYFDYVKYGICSILCSVGISMIVSKWYPVSLPWMCAIICILFVTSVVASVLKIVIYGSDEDESDKDSDWLKEELTQSLDSGKGS